MLPRWNRLRRGDFPRLYKRGCRQRSQSYVWWWLGVPTTEPTRIGVVISTKVSRRAVVRNLCRRRLSAGLRSLSPYLPSTGYHMVISANPTVQQRTFHELVGELRGTLTALKR